MISLIPNEEKKRMRRDFYIRFLVVSLVMLSLSIFIATTTMLPSFFISVVRKNADNTKLEIQKKEPALVLSQESLSAIKDLKDKVVLIETSDKDEFVVSKEIVDQILSKKMPDIKITQISYDISSTKVKKININGMAPSRERLLLFRQALENSTVFTKVDLPISNFIKGSNIQFFLTLTSS
jgi:nitrogen regulatory protein PII-like uncharacterized protein